MGVCLKWENRCWWYTTITTQGQITYLGSCSGNNSIPIGMISRNLFASTILGQRDYFSDS